MASPYNVLFSSERASERRENTARFIQSVSSVSCGSCQFLHPFFRLFRGHTLVKPGTGNQDKDSPRCFGYFFTQKISAAFSSLLQSASFNNNSGTYWPGIRTSFSSPTPSVHTFQEQNLIIFYRDHSGSQTASIQFRFSPLHRKDFRQRPELSLNAPLGDCLNQTSGSSQEKTFSEHRQSLARRTYETI